MKVMIATGGTGGHLFPAMAVAKELKNQDHQVTFIGSIWKNRKYINEQGFSWHHVTSKGYVGKNLLGKCEAVLYICAATVQSIVKIIQYKPKLVIGFGGYGALPVMLAAICLGKATLIHEQNVIPGRANHLLAKFVKLIAISFRESEAFFKKTVILTGCPCHSSQPEQTKAEILKSLQLEDNRRTILVFGGSQGSNRINDVFLQASKILNEQNKTQVIHVVGSDDLEMIKEFYQTHNIPAAVMSFTNEMPKFYTAADVVVARAGALTVMEIVAFKKPAVLIPYPFANQHQAANAAVLAEHKTASVVEEKYLDAEELVRHISTDKNDEKRLNQLRMEIVFPDAAVRIVNAALAISK